MSQSRRKLFLKSVAYVALSSKRGENITLPLMNPDTGKIERYQLVKLADPVVHTAPAPFHAHTSGNTRPHASPCTFTEDCPLGMPPAESTSPVQPPEDCLLDVSLDEIPAGADSSWSTSCSAPPPTPSFEAPARFRARTSSPPQTPSLLHESQPSFLTSPSLSESPPRPPPSPTAEGAASAGRVGLGILGMCKDDGSAFDGLGVLPRTCRVPRDAWGWARVPDEPAQAQPLFSTSPRHLDPPDTERLLDERLPPPPPPGSPAPDRVRAWRACLRSPAQEEDVFWASPPARSTPRRAGGKARLRDVSRVGLVTPEREGERRPAWRP